MPTQRKEKRSGPGKAAERSMDPVRRPEDFGRDLAQVIEEGRFSDRDVLEAILEVLLSLAGKITGKTVAVSLRNKHGHRAPIGASENGVYYL
ncbi:MAG TPA: hypothetical protein VH592_15345 [Gemmataceae bacterium]|jgi:hypothetical protein